MIKSCVTISLVPSLSGGPWIYWDDLQISIPRARNAGFDAVELFTASADAVNPTVLSRLLAENQIELAAVGTGAGNILNCLSLTSQDKTVRQNAVAYAADMIEFGARFGAPAIIGSIQGNVEKGVPREQALAWLAEGMNLLGKKAATCGTQLIYELLNRYESNLINRMAEGTRFVRSLQTENVTLLADLFHMNIEEESISDAIRGAGQDIGYVHFADSNRRPPGMGHTDIKTVAQALRDINYDGYISAEALPYPDSDRAAEQTIRAFRQFILPAFQ